MQPWTLREAPKKRLAGVVPKAASITKEIKFS
jgi:hypothetical protein